ncbi:hypothetical protein SASPL_149781 [Salvia splendens]|uniref:J domain-containing protein n=1 Tax=Salvia splendens TaxID=180675 RepID=A0A8X8W5L6_SALSN|nr:hypothetical protein SASPL_149781 [Salvia splendens]
MAAEKEKNSDFYGVMGPNCKLRMGFLKLKKWHPDRCSASANQKFVKEAKEKFQDIQQVYSVLSDANKRFLYDVGTCNSDDDVENFVVVAEVSFKQSIKVPQENVNEFWSWSISKTQREQPKKECQEWPEVAAGGTAGSGRSRLGMASRLEAYLLRYSTTSSCHIAASNSDGMDQESLKNFRRIRSETGTTRITETALLESTSDLAIQETKIESKAERGAGQNENLGVSSY